MLFLGDRDVSNNIFDMAFKQIRHNKHPHIVVFTDRRDIWEEFAVKDGWRSYSILDGIMDAYIENIKITAKNQSKRSVFGRVLMIVDLDMKEIYQNPGLRELVYNNRHYSLDTVIFAEEDIRLPEDVVDRMDYSVITNHSERSMVCYSDSVFSFINDEVMKNNFNGLYKRYADDDFSGMVIDVKCDDLNKLYYVSIL